MAQTSKKTLWLDSTSSSVFMALTEGDCLIHHEQSQEGAQQAEKILPLLDECLNNSSCTLEDIGQIVAVSGPGSFTSVRIGLAFVKTLSQLLDIPLKTIHRFELLYGAYEEQLKDKSVILSLHSFRYEPFIQWMDQGQIILKPQSVIKENLIDSLSNNKSVFLFGDVELPFWQAHDFSDLKRIYEDKRHPFLLLFEKSSFSKHLPLRDDHQAFYIRPADVSLSQKKNKKIL